MKGHVTHEIKVFITPKELMDLAARLRNLDEVLMCVAGDTQITLIFDELADAVETLNLRDEEKHTARSEK